MWQIIYELSLYGYVLLFDLHDDQNLKHNQLKPKKPKISTNTFRLAFKCVNALRGIIANAAEFLIPDSDCKGFYIKGAGSAFPESSASILTDLWTGDGRYFVKVCIMEILWMNQFHLYIDRTCTVTDPTWTCPVSPVSREGKNR